MVMDDWQDLKFLLALVEHGSLPAAAEALDVNRTTVSRRIASLEQRLGVKLVQKVGRSLVPTDAGFETLLVSATASTAPLTWVGERPPGMTACRA